MAGAAGAGRDSALLAPLRDSPRSTAILCDVDGTLAPIVADPHAAAVPAAARAVLRGLARRYGLVACVTGRRANQARRMVGLDELVYAGNHGLELLRPGQREPEHDPAIEGRAGAAAAFVARLDWRRLEARGLRLEDKGPIQAIHWRGAVDETVAEGVARDLAELVAEEGLVPHFGRRVLEVRPVREVHKGIAVERLVVEAGARCAMFGGDDRTDLDGFSALRALRDAGRLEAAVCVGVDSDEAPPELVGASDLVVTGTGGYLDLLRELDRPSAPG